jgi:hypothetical protein
MNITEQIDQPANHELSPVNDVNGGGWLNAWHGQAHMLEHGRWAEGSYASNHPQAPFGHGSPFGWMPESWGEAGGFGHPFGGDPGGRQMIDNPILQSSNVETTNLILDPGPGGTINIGGNVEALANQSTTLMAALSQIGSLSQQTQAETTNIIFDAANGGMINVGGNVVAASTQQSDVEPQAGMDFSQLA